MGSYFDRDETERWLLDEDLEILEKMYDLGLIGLGEVKPLNQEMLRVTSAIMINVF